MNARKLFQSIGSKIFARSRYAKKALWILVGISALVLALALGVRLSQAQGQMPENVTVQVEKLPAVAVGGVIPIQGRLTNASGTPLNGTYGIQANIYNASGTFLCGDWQNVIVTNGLFTMNVGTGLLSTPCQSTQINGEELYLGIKAGPFNGAEPEMTPRQPIYPVPYAWTVKPGAIIKGADTDVFVPGSALVKNVSTDTTRWDMAINGSAQVWRGATVGAKYVFIPITLPGVLYGQAVTVKSVTVYYRCQNGANNYIYGTSLTKQSAADTYVSLFSDATARTSNTATSYTLNPINNNVLSSNEGILGLYLTLSFANDTDYIQIGGVKLVLSHQ